MYGILHATHAYKHNINDSIFLTLQTVSAVRGPSPGQAPLPQPTIRIANTTSEFLPTQRRLDRAARKRCCMRGTQLPGTSTWPTLSMWKLWNGWNSWNPLAFRVSVNKKWNSTCGRAGFFPHWPIQPMPSVNECLHPVMLQTSRKIRFPQIWRDWIQVKISRSSVALPQSS